MNTQVINNEAQELREKIEKSNISCKRLTKHGFSLQGITKNMTQIAVCKDNKLYFFKNYIIAANELLNNETS